MGCAYVTLVTNNDYLLGATALCRSIRRVDQENSIVVLTTQGDLDFEPLLREQAQILEVDHPKVSDEFITNHSRERQHSVAPFTKGKKPVFHNPIDNFCKLRLWELDQFDRVVFIDADAIVVKDISKLFQYPEFTAAPNLYETLSDFHRLNSGVFVARPDKGNYAKMIEALDYSGAFWRRTDQTFLESFFPEWHGMPYLYNTLQYVYFNLPELWRWSSIRVVHYQYEKPWEEDHPKRDLLQPLIELWYSVLEGKPLPEELPVLN